MNDRAKVTLKYAAEKAFLKTHSHPWFPNQHQGPIGSNANSILNPNDLRIKRSQTVEEGKRCS